MFPSLLLILLRFVLNWPKSSLYSIKNLCLPQKPRQEIKKACVASAGARKCLCSRPYLLMYTILDMLASYKCVYCFLCLVTSWHPYEYLFVPSVTKLFLCLRFLKFTTRFTQEIILLAAQLVPTPFSLRCHKEFHRIHIERKTFHCHKCENIFTLREDFVRHNYSGN